MFFVQIHLLSVNIVGAALFNTQGAVALVRSYSVYALMCIALKSQQPYQECTELCASLLCRLVKRSETPLVGGVDHSVELYEQGRNFEVPIGGSVVQWDETALVLRVHVSTVIQKELRHFEVVVSGFQINIFMEVHNFVNKKHTESLPSYNVTTNKNIER